MRWLAFIACLSLLPTLAFPASAGDEGAPEAICDKLAADPFAGAGPKSWDKPFQDVDAARAVPACEAAMGAHPGEARYRLQAAVAYMAAHNEARARELLQQLVDEDSAPAMVLLANISRDAESVALIQRAAALNNTAALIFLAFANLSGDGVNQNILEGIRLLNRAADLGNTEAMIILAGVYFDGQFGVPPDAAEGRRLIMEAAARGNQGAKKVLAEIEKAQAAAARMQPQEPSAKAAAP